MCWHYATRSAETEIRNSNSSLYPFRHRAIINPRGQPLTVSRLVYMDMKVLSNLSIGTNVLIHLFL